MATAPSLPSPSFDNTRFENTAQIGGIRTGTFDHAGRVALVDTGSGLSFTVALDRGGDILDARFNQHGLAFLTQVPLRPPNHAFHQGLDWLRNWPGGLVTTCGPQHIGGPSVVNGENTSLHGRYSNLPAEVEMLLNPDLHRGRREMLLSLVVRDAKMFGPVLEVRRQIQCTLGEPVIHIYDSVMNRGSQTVPHHWLYHVNLGYPLLNEGAKVILRGKASYWSAPTPPQPVTEQTINGWKRVSAPLPHHAGTGEHGVITDSTPDATGRCRVGLVNRQIGLGLALEYPAEALPRIANWHHLGPAGSYVMGIEPFAGSLMGVAKDKHPLADRKLEPGQTARYQLTLRVLRDEAALADLEAWDGPLTLQP